MPIYISRGRFTSDAIKGMVAKPENREEAVSKLFESVGGRPPVTGWLSASSPMLRPPPLRYSPLPREAACLMSRRPRR
jgi:hypothetical protein